MEMIVKIILPASTHDIDFIGVPVEIHLDNNRGDLLKKKKSNILLPRAAFISSLRKLLSCR